MQNEKLEEYRRFLLSLVTPQVRHPERMFLRERSPVLAKMCHLRRDPSRKNMSSG